MNRDLDYLENAHNIERKELFQFKQEAMKLRKDIIEGYKDFISGRVHEFSGELMADLKVYRRNKMS